MHEGGGQGLALAGGGEVVPDLRHDLQPRGLSGDDKAAALRRHGDLAAEGHRGFKAHQRQKGEFRLGP